MTTTLATKPVNLMEAHEQWRDRPADQRFETLEALKASVGARRLRSRSTDIDLGRIHVEDTGTGIIINSAISPCEPSHWSFGQLATNLKAPAGYLRTLPRPLLVQCLQNGLAKSETEAVKFMTVSGEDGPATLQAVTSTTYGRIWDADCVDSVARIQERTGGRFYNPKAYIGGQQRPSGLYASDHDVFMFMIDGGSRLDVGERAKLNRGFMVWNSETGAKSFGMMTFLFNEVCGNHIIWGAKDINKLVIRHSSGGPYRFDSQAAPALRAYAESSAKPLEDGIKRAIEYRLTAGKPSVDEVQAWCAKHGKFTRSEVSEAIAFAKSEEGACETLWQLVQGFTAYARGFDWVDARIDLEKRAGALLNLVSGE